MQVKKQQLELDMKQWTGSKLERSTLRLYIVTLFTEFICRVYHANVGLDDSQIGNKITRRNNNFRYTGDTTLMAESEEDLKSLLIRMKKKKSENTGLKLSVQNTKIMTSDFNTSWQTEVKNVEAVTDPIFLGSKITVDGDCSSEIRRCLLFGRKAMINLDRRLKSSDIILPTNIHIVKAMVFPVCGNVRVGL